MHLSDEGMRLIKSFEGYHKRLQNGDCAAYLCPANVPTIGYGCTEGVKIGMVWTAEKAEKEFRRELAKFEDGVTRLVTTEINQNQFDALVSFAYNVGVGGFQDSSVLKRVNKGDFAKVPAALGLWNKGGGKVLPGLVSRRQREGALFMKPAEAPEEPYMPQEVTASVPFWLLWVRRVLAFFGIGTTGTVVANEAGMTIPDPPDLSWAVNWKGFGETLWSLLTWAIANPIPTLFVGGFLVVLAFPSLLPKSWRPA